MEEMDDFFGNDELDREPSPFGEEAIEDNTGEDGEKRIVEPKLTRIKRLTNPRLALNEKTLTGPKGVQALRDSLAVFKPNPKDCPYANLDKLMKKYAHWGHRMFPKMKTEDVLNRVETLGTRRMVKVFMMKHRMGESADFEEMEQSSKKSTNGIIDDGAEETEPHDDLIGDEPENVKKGNKTPSPSKMVPSNNEIDDESFAMMEERFREEQEAKDADAEDELMADFDLNNDW